MTLEEKFSSAWGFEENVAIEVLTIADESFVGYYGCINDVCLILKPTKTSNSAYSPVFDFIHSLRILTPPWSAWLFVPTDNKDIVGVYVDVNDMYPMHFATIDPRQDQTDPWVDGQGIWYLPRPWWLDKGPMED